MQNVISSKMDKFLDQPTYDEKWQSIPLPTNC